MVNAKEAQKYIDIRKLVRVTKSCLTENHVIGAFGYIVCFIKRHDLKRNPLIREVIDGCIAYLQDTRDHAVYRFHKPKWNNRETVSTYPNLNNYLKHLKVDINWELV